MIILYFVDKLNQEVHGCVEDPRLIPYLKTTVNLNGEIFRIYDLEYVYEEKKTEIFAYVDLE